MGSLLEDRRASSGKRLSDLKTKLGSTETRLAGKACVYVTGSFGRAEAGTHSDLDLFIVGLGTADKPQLTRLDQICVKADLVHANREMAFPDFSGDGEYLEHYAIGQLVKTLGTPDDDATNTFTARLLLLLESRPLLGVAVYTEVINDVVAAYWRDYEDHRDEFIPAFLANDILRLWRTFCVNYEARTSTEPEEKKAKRRLKNYKLKHSRLLTCYSALAFLSATYAMYGSVKVEAVQEMVNLTPTQRLEHLAGLTKLTPVRASIEKIVTQYEAFLTQTDAPEAVLIERFLDSHQRKAFDRASDLGDLIYELLSGISQIGQGQKFHRLLLV